MSFVNGFLIILMLLLLFYSLYRSVKKRSLLMLIPVCLQIFAAVIAAMSFFHNVEALPAVEAVYIMLGIIPPSAILICDYICMTRKIRLNGTFNGLVEKVPAGYDELSFPREGINDIEKMKQTSEIIDELKYLPEELHANFRKCIIRAKKLLNGQDPTGAAVMYETLSKAAGSSYALYYNYACVCYRHGKYEEALNAYKNSLNLYNGDDAGKRPIYYNLGNSSYMLGRYEKAAAYYEKSLGLSPDDPKTLENLSYTYVRMGEADKGIGVLKRIPMDEGRYRPHYVWGRLFSEAARFTEAEEELKKAVKLDPDVIEAREELGKVLIKLGKNDEAISVYNDILLLDPDNFSSWYNMAAAHVRAKRWKDAAKCFREAVRIRPDSHKSYYNLAMALEESGDRESSIKAYQKSIELQPDFADAYNNLGILLTFEGRREEALEVYEEGIRRSPGDYSLHLNMGICLLEEGRNREAAAAFRNALDIKPDELEIYYYLGAALIEMRHFNDAIDAYTSALKIKPADGEIQYHLASVYAMLGRYDIAGENLKRAIELDRSILEDLKVNSAFDGMRGRADFKKMIS
jgi:tetratricopeptide (TPR) repeat protein